MVNQKAISAKIEYGVLEQLERESFTSGRKKNRIINDALKMYIDLQDLKRYLGCIKTESQRFNMTYRVLERHGLHEVTLMLVE